MKKQALLERAKERGEDRTEPNDIDDLGNFVYTRPADRVVAFEAYGTGILGKENLEQPDSRILAFGSIGTGVVSGDALRTTNQVQQAAVADFYASTKEEKGKFVKQQTEISRFIREKIGGDSVKEWTNQTILVPR
jgi:hypothetical protein